MQVKIISLKEYNTFNIDVKALYSFFCDTEKELFKILKFDIIGEKNVLVLGGGSNILFLEDVKDVLILMRNKGIEIVKEDEKNVLINYLFRGK